MRRYFLASIFLLLTVCGTLPFLAALTGSPLADPIALALLNMIAWMVAMALLFNRSQLTEEVRHTAQGLGIDGRFSSLEKVLTRLLYEMNRKNSSLLVNLVERRITTKEELSRTFEQIVALSFRLLDAESAELSLFDRESGMYHSAFVMGKPFRSSAQAMLSGAIEKDRPEEAISPDVLVQPIAFAGSVLGTLRVGLRRGKLPSIGDREILKLLALQSSVAMINLQYNFELLRMKQASEESVKAKTGFLANLSHEIRGPLGIILNAVELVLDGLCGDITSDQRETLSMVHSNGEHLLELINDVLDYAKAESGRVQPAQVDILAEDLLQDLVGVVRAQAEAKHHKVIYKPHQDALGFTCDRRHARQMLINLLTNAIKYTPDGGSIEVWAERTPGNKVKLSVRDSGVGIDEADRAKVFSAFERVENAYSMKQVGTGLGMPLTKRLAEVNGGHLDFSSVPGKGSHFWLLFPAIDIKKSDVVASEEPKEEVLGRGETVLLVAPGDGERAMIERYLTHRGFNLVLASTEREALELAKDRKIDLCILDNTVVDESAEQFVPEIRRRSVLHTLPIILLSTRAFVFDIEGYLKAGVDRCLAKPAELKELGSVVRSLLDSAYAPPRSDDLTKTKPNEMKKSLRTTAVRSKDLLH